MLAAFCDALKLNPEMYCHEKQRLYSSFETAAEIANASAAASRYTPCFPSAHSAAAEVAKLEE
jgi:hypothetical protein